MFAAIRSFGFRGAQARRRMPHAVMPTASYTQANEATAGEKV